MDISIGNDIVNIKRIEAILKKTPEHFVNKLLTRQEIIEFEKRKFASLRVRASYLAKRFAGKEAVAKALGTGFTNGLTLHSIEILKDKIGKPYVNILHKNFKHANISISLSDDYPFAEAVAVVYK